MQNVEGLRFVVTGLYHAQPALSEGAVLSVRTVFTYNPWNKSAFFDHNISQELFPRGKGVGAHLFISPSTHF